VDTHN